MALTDGIRNIVFDLGGVVVDIDLNRTFDQMKALGVPDLVPYVSKYSGGGFAEAFQTGHLSEQGFVEHLCQLAGRPLPYDEVERAWNAMILEYEPDRIHRLRSLKSRYRTFVLSNTNVMHHRDFAFRVPGESDLRNLFEKVYYSHEIGLSKPSPESYLYVMHDAGLLPEDTLFLDDSADNVAAAQALGMRARQVTYGREWLEWL